MYSIVIENIMIIVHLKYIYNAPPIFFQFSNPFAPPLTSNPGSALDDGAGHKESLFASDEIRVLTEY